MSEIHSPTGHLQAEIYAILCFWGLGISNLGTSNQMPSDLSSKLLQISHL